jgi:exosortase/archaeosortase family protein
LLFIGITTPGGIYIKWLDINLNYIKYWRAFDIQLTRKILIGLGYEVKYTTYTVLVTGRAGFKLVYSCLGYGVMSFFFAFVMAYPRPWIYKTLFLLYGLTLIQILNLIRLTWISIYWTAPKFGKLLDHHTVFNLIIYSTIIIILYLWTNSNKHNGNYQFKNTIRQKKLQNWRLKF